MSFLIRRGGRRDEREPSAPGLFMILNVGRRTPLAKLLNAIMSR